VAVAVAGGVALRCERWIAAAGDVAERLRAGLRRRGVRIAPPAAACGGRAAGVRCLPDPASPPGVAPWLWVGPVVLVPVVAVEGPPTVTVSWAPPAPPLASVTCTETVQTPGVSNWIWGAG
jgi:hypothetical protein